jgi:formylglycine-generating enzyme required for sulfatase activity
MATILKLKDIDEAIANLGYKNKETLKWKLVRAIRQYYPDEISTECIQAIDTEQLVKKLWTVDNDSVLLKSKKKNLSSVKTVINADFKRLYHEGRNPQGVVIGQSNVFDMSDEAKNKALGTFDAILREEGTDAIRKITEMLNAANNILTEFGSKPRASEGLGSFGQMKDLLIELSRKMGLSFNGGAATNVATDSDVEVEDIEDVMEEKVSDEIVVEVEAVDSAEILDETSEMLEEVVDEIYADVSEEEVVQMADDEPKEIRDEASEAREVDGLEEAEIQDIVIHRGGDESSDEVVKTTLAATAVLEEMKMDADLAEVGLEDILEEQVDETFKAADDDLREKGEILAELAEAAKVLSKLGPDFSESVYSEEVIREKAKLLSKEFERDLSMREKCYNQHIFIKSGEYITGGNDLSKNELPEGTVYLQEFYIGKFPLTNALFETFVEKTGYRTTAERNGYGFVYTPRAQRTKDSMTGKETFTWHSHLLFKKIQGACWYHPNGLGSSLHNKRRHPVVQVSLEDACAFAAWTGKRIPTEKEWEAAARTANGYIRPWGNDWAGNSCNVEKSYIGDTTPVDKYLESANEYGVVDTLGNVLEWTLDNWKTQKLGEKKTDIHIVKGGSWISDGSISLSNRYPMEKNTSSNILGFRCVAI